MDELYADSIQKAYGVKQLLTDIFISCRPGDVIGLLGRNGSGKSTLLQIVFGSLRAENSFIKIDQMVISSLADGKDKIGYLPQTSFLPGHLTIKTIVHVFCQNSDRTSVENHPHVRPFLYKKPHQLSGGERRLIEILIIIHTRKRYILMDEPFNGIEPIYKEEVKALILTHARHTGFIITDHDYKNILELATKTILLLDGKTREIKFTEELVHWGYIKEKS